MSAKDKLKNAGEKIAGSVKEKVGEATDDRELQSEGRADQTSADLKQAGEKVKDVFGGP